MKLPTNCLREERSRNTSEPVENPSVTRFSD
jgi:hypothetical protein